MKNILALLCSASLLSPLMAHAQDSSMVSFGVGYYDILDDAGATDFRIEYRPNKSIVTEDLRPWIGAEGTTDGSFWGGGGILYDWEVTPNVYLVPSFGAGLYTQGSSDKDLGFPIEFRSQLEAAYQFPSTGQRLGVAFGHLSNASLDDENPGTEVLNLYYHLPVN